MCGFSGYIGGLAGGVDTLSAMGHALAHRGPDGSGMWVDEVAQIGMTHQRLAIVDLSAAGNQPMVSELGRYVISFNGEIYNHNELRVKLKYNNFKGNSDTETILECVEEWGLETALKEAVGMFAFALWDRRESKLHLARDRLGEKPLYYGWQGEGHGRSFLFGSELKALKVHPSFSSEVNRDAVALFLRHNYIPAPYSIYQGISKLLPGTILTVSLDDKHPKISPYWSVDDILEKRSQSPYKYSDETLLEDLEAQLMQSIKRQMVADVPLGAFLSGGIDSSLIVSLMQHQSNSPIKTFTIGFSESGYNEAEYARAVANHLKTDHTELYISPQKAMDVIPLLPTLYDEPFSDSSQIPTFLVSQLARKNVIVSLSGDGGDELFCGYNRYLFTDKLWSKLSLLPLSVRRGLANVVTTISPTQWSKIFGFLSSGNVGDKIHKAAKVIDAASANDLYVGLISHWGSPESIVLNSREPNALLSMEKLKLSNLSQIEKMMLLDLVTYLPCDILTKVDRAAMGVSLEVRVPFLDHNVVEFAWSMPMNFKIRNGETKWALRQILYKYVPKALIERPKMGFGVPIDSWLRGPLREWAECLLDESRLRKEGFFDPSPIREKWEEHLSGRRNWQHLLWDVLMFQAWLEVQ